MDQRHSFTVSLPNAELVEALGTQQGVDATMWAMDGPAPRNAIDLVVVPYMSPPSILRSLAGVHTQLVQSQTIGFEGVSAELPMGVRYSNAAGVHEASTAELALGLMIAAQREIGMYARAQVRGEWRHHKSRALTDSRVMVIGNGAVGRAIAARLEPFEVDVVRVATRGSVDGPRTIFGVDQLPSLLGEVDIVVLAVPLNASTTGLVDRGFLQRMKRGSLLVNVSRGPVVVTQDLLKAVASKHVRAALDVVDPEPLPPDHPLWGLDDVLMTPHVGGHSEAMTPRVVALVRRQIAALQSGSEPHNVVVDRRFR
ncbi:2-hydroxyacid dehydrogenase [Arthrobacter sp. 92]|uniref:2-hydroxyacid dehydrogenase n=1 Tax=Arthrobacter sp. 92 TaxID=3418175 RepID=UPI003CFF5EB8